QRELTVRLRQGHLVAAALDRDACVAKRLALLVEHASADARRSLGDALHLAAVVFHFDDCLVLRYDAESTQRQEPVRHLGRHFARADAVAEHLNLAGHVARDAAVLVAAGRVDRRLARTQLLSADDVRLVKHELHLRADRRALAIRIAYEAHHHRGTTRALR